MSVVLTVKKETPDSTSEITWQDYATYTQEIEHDADYRFLFSTEYSGELTNRGISIRAMLDDHEVHREARIPNDIDERFTLSGVYFAHLAAGEHTVKVQYVVEHTTQTIHCYNAYMTVDKF